MAEIEKGPLKCTDPKASLVPMDILDPPDFRINVLDEHEIDMLALSLMKKGGNQKPLIVWNPAGKDYDPKDKKTHWKIVDGWQTFKAAKKAGFGDIWVKFNRYESRREANEASFIANQRGTEDRLQIARLMEQWMLDAAADKKPATNGACGAAFNKGESRIRQYLAYAILSDKVAALPEGVRDLWPTDSQIGLFTQDQVEGVTEDLEEKTEANTLDEGPGPIEQHTRATRAAKKKAAADAAKNMPDKVIHGIIKQFNKLGLTELRRLKASLDGLIKKEKERLRAEKEAKESSEEPVPDQTV